MSAAVLDIIAGMSMSARCRAELTEIWLATPLDDRLPIMRAADRGADREVGGQLAELQIRTLRIRALLAELRELRGGVI